MPFDNPVTDWSAVVKPIFDHTGKEIDPTIGRGVYRTDDDSLLAICGQNFKPVQHQDVLEPMLQTLHDQGYEIQERTNRAPHQRDFYDLKGQRGAFVNTQMQANGAIMRSDIVVGDFTTPKGLGNDILLRRFTALNSHDGTYAVKSSAGYFRLVCMNGMVNEKFSASSYGKHTSNFSIDALKRSIMTAAEMMENDGERFGLYAGTRLSIDKAEDFLKATLAKLPLKANGDENYSEPLTLNILGLFKNEDQTVWGLLNAMTNWATHGDIRQGSGVVTSRTGRDDRVARAMRSTDFEQLLAA
jgi:hypothetical protein